MGLFVACDLSYTDCYSPERMSIRYEDDENARKESGFEQSTYATIFDRLDREETDVSN